MDYNIDMKSADVTIATSDLSHFKEVFTSFYDFYCQQRFCDFTIHVQDENFKCHRIVLAACSGYFQSMFSSEMQETRKGYVVLPELDSEAMGQLLQFMYTAEINITIENVQNILFAGSFLQITSLVNRCSLFMSQHLDVVNCIEVCNFANTHGIQQLVSNCEQFIIENFCECVTCPDFAKLRQNCILKILDSDDLNVTNESEVFDALMKWYSHNQDSSDAFYSLFLKVRLKHLPPHFLVDVVSGDQRIKDHMLCRDLVDDAKHFHMVQAGMLSIHNQLPLTKPRKTYAGVIFCVGGRGATGQPFKSVEYYDIICNNWFSVADMSTRRRHVGVAAVAGKIYAVGGHDGSSHLSSGEVYNPSLDKWQPIQSMTKERRGIALAYLEPFLYALGGLDDSSCFNTVEKYDIQSDMWIASQPMNAQRGGVAAVTFRNAIYAIGGNNGLMSLETCEKYDTQSNKWKFISSMNMRRAGAGVAEHQAFLYVAGGFDDNSPLDSVEIYDPTHESWTKITSMSSPRGGVGLVTLAGQLYAVGGHDGQNYLSTVEQYDEESQKWIGVASIGTCRAGAGVVTIAYGCLQLRKILQNISFTNTNTTCATEHL